MTPKHTFSRITAANQPPEDSVTLEQTGYVFDRLLRLQRERHNKACEPLASRLTELTRSSAHDSSEAMPETIDVDHKFLGVAQLETAATTLAARAKSQKVDSAEQFQVQQRLAALDERHAAQLLRLAGAERACQCAIDSRAFDHYAGLMEKEFDEMLSQLFQRHGDALRADVLREAARGELNLQRSYHKFVRVCEEELDAFFVSDNNAATIGSYGLFWMMHRNDAAQLPDDVATESSARNLDKFSNRTNQCVNAFLRERNARALADFGVTNVERFVEEQLALSRQAKTEPLSIEL